MEKTLLYTILCLSSLCSASGSSASTKTYSAKCLNGKAVTVDGSAVRPYPYKDYKRLCRSSKCEVSPDPLKSAREGGDGGVWDRHEGLGGREAEERAGCREESCHRARPKGLRRYRAAVMSNKDTITKLAKSVGVPDNKIATVDQILKVANNFSRRA
ncbi:hypothetical protein Q5P01_000823 [Channa striata]|uniref:Uncharacterized protein n=1 Tax=Channa striata TaxID=64152 RepID=A0AA88IWU5_CHASR|nr:hypothetical protein Q5P01_000823 [Channa striata]